MLSLTTRFCAEPQAYDGTPLSPHWIFRHYGVKGNAVVAFVGPADVALDHMVDLEDVQRKAPIGSPEMVHFLGEFFCDSLDWGILVQHLLVAEFYEWLMETRGSRGFSRVGNDVFYQGRKLSVSIATKSPVSVLVHVGVNVRTEGTPVPTSGLAELDVGAKEFAEAVLARFERDFKIWQSARVKVLPR